VPLRVFVGRLRYSLYSGTGLALLGVLALLQLVGALVLGHWGTAAVAGGFVAGVLVATLAFLAPGTRRVLKAGYGPAGPDRRPTVLGRSSTMKMQQCELVLI